MIPHGPAPRAALALALAVSLLLGSAALAQVGETREGADFAMTGAVKAVDAAKHTLTLEGANLEGGVLEVDPKATLENGDRKIGLGDLKPGWRVVVNGDLRSGKKVVTYLEVVDTP
jgi:hypothetical protein